MTTVEVFAPAKINLTLHVTGQRADGYHALDSLVAFAPAGDKLWFKPRSGLEFDVDGPEAAHVPKNETNLVWRAAEFLSEGRGAGIHLTKSLPVASGMGGGSADAAAAVRGLMMLWLDEVEREKYEKASDEQIGQRMAGILRLGADIPMCLLSKPCRARGIGEQLDFVELPPLPAVIVNPRLPLDTPRVFSGLTNRHNPAMPVTLPFFADAGELAHWLTFQRNDLQDPAIALEPKIGEVLEEIAGMRGCILSRMSGSGATCFGVFSGLRAALAAAQSIEDVYPHWWVKGGYIGDWSEQAAPQLTT
ncbi:MAG: 4-(cytidine 5'-diphospho)-2-C-methyl-D-erythritol kinase [Pseudomonadota bacterium]